MTISLDGLREYANLMPDDNNTILELCLDAAIQHAKDAGIPEFLFMQEKPDPKLTLYIYALAAHWFDNREFRTDTFVKRESAKIRRELMYKEEPDGQEN